MNRFLAVFLLFSGAEILSAVEFIAHRGASADAPENTLASVRLGWRQHADAVEIDVYRTRDDRVVVLHDATTKRTTGFDLKVAEASLAEVRQLDAGRWKGEQWAGERIPTLEEVLATIPAGKRLFIEVKCGPEILPALQRALAQSGKEPAQTVIIGFSHETMKQAKAALPALKVHWLASFEQQKETGAWKPSIDELIARAREAGVDGLNLAWKGPLDAAVVGRIREANLEVYTWTVNDPTVARALAEAGVAGITTDRPAWLREQIR